jgi:hypothetical protein
VAERDSGWVGGSVVDAQDARLATGMLIQAGAGPLQVRQGVKPASGTPGLVKQTGTASKNITIEPFQAAIQATRATAGGPYLATLDAQKTVDLLTANPADATNARRDLIIARQSDTQWSDASTAMVVQQVVGTPSGSPVDPTPAAGDFITLARVTVPATATTIVSANITDLRPFAVATGGILPVTTQTERDALTKYTSMAVWRLDLNQMEAWNGTTWGVVGPAAAPAYAHDEGGGSRTVASSASFLDFTGQPTVTVTVPASGVLKCEWGFVGYNNASESATLRLGPVMSGANTVAATTPISACVAGGASTTPPRSASRSRLFTGLTPGSTTVKLQGRLSSGTTSTHAIQDSWLYVEPRV